MSLIEVLGAAVDAFCAESIEDLTAGEALAVLGASGGGVAPVGVAGAEIGSESDRASLAGAVGRHLVSRGVVTALAYG
ncbi:hypothetical protein MABM_31240 [Mycobacteroides abscessus]|nr:hypothetical protein MABM_31240 [Mycobacteroides abscessus]